MGWVFGGEPNIRLYVILYATCEACVLSLVLHSTIVHDLALV